MNGRNYIMTGKLKILLINSYADVLSTPWRSLTSFGMTFHGGHKRGKEGYFAEQNSLLFLSLNHKNM